MNTTDLISGNFTGYESVLAWRPEEDSVVPIDLSHEAFEKWVVETTAQGYDYFMQSIATRFLRKQDRTWFLKNTTVTYILPRIIDGNSYSVYYLDAFHEGKTYYQFKYILDTTDETCKTILFGGRHISQDLFNEQEKLEKYREVIDALAEDYLSIYYIDPITNEYTRRDQDFEYSKALHSQMKENDDYFEYLRLNYKDVVYEEDWDIALLLMDKDYLKMALDVGTLERDYRMIVDGKPEWFRQKVKKTVDSKGAEHWISAFAQLSEEKSRDLEFEQNLRIIQTFAAEYSSVYYVNLITEELTPYAMNRNTETAFGEVYRSGILYSDAFKLYVSQFVNPDYREIMLEEGKVETIKRKLSEHLSFSTRYVNEQGHFCEMKCVRVGGLESSGTPVEAVVLGFADKNDTIRQDMEMREQLNLARERAEAASVAKTEFLFNMSHDIRTPMNAIIGFTNMASESIYDPRKALDYLNKVKLSSNHLLSLINDVLDMARVESGETNITEGVCNLFRDIDNLLTIIRSTAREKDIDLQVKYINVDTDIFLADDLHMDQVFLNILSNAIKYTPKGGYVKFYIEEIACERPDYVRYVFKIEDNGIGMSEEFLEHVFDSFSREQSSTISGIQGTGLGMAIVKRLVDLMGGTIRVDSTEGKGTTVTLTIDFKKITEDYAETDTVVSTLENKDISLDGMQILLVEDNELNREIIKAILEKKGIIVTEAENGAEAVHLMESPGAGEFELILMDIQMPVMNGYEATKYIRELPDEKLAGIPILALTANVFDEDRKQALLYGMNGHLGKPIDSNALYELLRKFR